MLFGFVFFNSCRASSSEKAAFEASGLVWGKRWIWFWVPKWLHACVHARTPGRMERCGWRCSRVGIGCGYGCVCVTACVCVHVSLVGPCVCLKFIAAICLSFALYVTSPQKSRHQLPPFELPNARQPFPGRSCLAGACNANRERNKRTCRLQCADLQQTVGHLIRHAPPNKYMFSYHRFEGPVK